MTATHCIAFTPPGLAELIEVEPPSLAPDCLLIETRYSGISPGTESRCLRGQQSGVDHQRCITGYQAVGRVLRGGSATKRKPDEVVFFSRAEAPVGFKNFNGAHARHVVVPESATASLPIGVDLTQAALGKITAVAYHGVKCGRIKSGETVAVLGLGLLGQLSARIAHSMGATVTAFDRQLARVAIAQEIGVNAHVATDPLSASPYVPATGFDVIIDATGSPGVIGQGIALAHELQPWDTPVHTGSRYVIQGSYVGDFSFDYEQVFMKELTIVVPRDNTAADLLAALNLIRDDKLQLANLIGTPVSPHDAQSIYDDLGYPESSRQTAVFDWQQIHP